MIVKQKLKNTIYNHKNIILSVAINIFFFLLFFIFNGVKYELSDDWFFSVNALNGHCDFTFCSYFIQYISVVLQKLIYPVNAFMLLQLILGFIALTTISYIFLDTFGNKKGTLLVLLIETAFAINVYSLITFSKTAGILATAGGIVIFWAISEKKNLMYSIYGIILAVLGSFYRFKIFYSVFLVFSFFVLGYIIYKSKKPFFKGFFNECREIFKVKTILIFVGLIASVFSLNSLSKNILHSNEDIEYYLKYNSLRSSVVDYQIPLYKENAEKYQALGVSKNDVQMLRKWYVDDQGLASIETLTGIAEMQEERQVQRSYFKYMLASFMGFPELLLLVFFILVVAGMIGLYKKKGFIFIFTISAAIGLLYLYLYLLGRCNYRSVFSIWFSATVCLLYSLRFLEIKGFVLSERLFKRKSFAVILALVYTFFLVYGFFGVTPFLIQRDGEEYPELESYIASSKNKIFALSRESYLMLRNSTQFDNPLVLTQNEAFDKCVYFGTPYYAHPSYNKLLENTGIDNLYTALAEKENLYFVDCVKSNGIETMITYLNEQYGEKRNYDSILIQELEKFNIYKIISIDKN